MKIIKSELTPIDDYMVHYEIQMDKQVDFKLLEEFCNIKEADYYFDLEIYDDDNEDNDIEWDSTKEPFLQDFLDKCKESNICIKDPLYWDLTFGIDGEDINIGYEGYNTIYLNMEGSKNTINKVLSIIEKIDKKSNVIKVVK